MPRTNNLNQLLAQATRHLDAQQWDKADRVLRRALKAAPTDAGILNRLAAVQARLGNHRKAMDSITTALKHAPDDRDCLTTRVDILARQARIGEAIEAAGDMIQRFPEDADLHAMRSSLLLHAGETNAAWDDMRRAHELRPDDLELLGRFVDATISRGIIPMERDPADRLAAAQPFESRNHARLGTILRLNDDTEASTAAYREALRLDPRNTDAIAGLAELRESAGDSEGALELLRPLVEAERAPLLPMLAWARILGRLGRHEQLVDDVRTWLDRSDRPGMQTAPLLFRLGNALDTLGRHDEAFEAWSAANAPFGTRWNDAAHEERVDAIVRCFPEAKPATGNTASNAPIFIVGMFRSGTTLLEQVLGAHPSVHPVGESPVLPELIRSLDGTYPENTETLDEQTLLDMGTRYMERVAVDAGDATHVTDKLPMNYMNVGLITRILPEARILHCRRDALDVCLSCFSNQMTSNLAFTSNLESMGRTYTQYRRLMGHWADSGQPMLDVDYEAMVADPEPHIRAILEWIGLPWDDACLAYHQSKRVAQTPSMDQVRQPMHTRSIHRSRAYWEHLAPLRTALGDLTPPRTP